MSTVLLMVGIAFLGFQVASLVYKVRQRRREQSRLFSNLKKGLNKGNDNTAADK